MYCVCVGGAIAIAIAFVVLGFMGLSYSFERALLHDGSGNITGLFEEPG